MANESDTHHPNGKTAPNRTITETMYNSLDDKIDYRISRMHEKEKETLTTFGGLAKWEKFVIAEALCNLSSKGQATLSYPCYIPAQKAMQKLIAKGLVIPVRDNGSTHFKLLID